jgi:hypothetical protein
MKTIGQMTMIFVLFVWILSKRKIDIPEDTHNYLTISLLGIAIMFLVLTDVDSK